MSRFHSYINTSVKLISTYKGEQPFAIFIKGFFANEKKYGSKDRKQISALCYDYFRLGFAMQDATLEEKLLVATFLCEQEDSLLLQNLQPEWNEKIGLPMEEKLALLKEQFLAADIFPFVKALSAGVNAEAFGLSMLTQPSLFLRIRPQAKLTTLKKLDKSKLPYELLGESAVQLAPATNVEEVFIIDKEVVVQDYNSQQVLNYLHLNEETVFDDAESAQPLSSWDCCAASGGKSILLYDSLTRKLDLTISDIRLSIVAKLHQRFTTANIKEYKYFIADISNDTVKPPATNYQLIICDAPCTGSGTWSRTPEQLSFFKEQAIGTFNERQKNMVSTVIPYLIEGGIFVYITCSVFKRENEVIADFIAEKFNLTVLHQELLTGYDKKADTMFVAIFKKISA